MKKIEPGYKGVNKGHYTPGIISGGMLYISGQLSLDPDTRIVPDGGVKEHARLALENLGRVLKAGGCTYEDVVQCRVYITDIMHWDEVNEVYKEYFKDHKPARAVVTVPQLHFGTLVEIEAVAEVR